MSSQPHVVHILPAYVPGPPDNFFRYAYSQVELSTALAAKGVQVTVLSRYGEQASLQRDGVQYEFTPDKLPPGMRFWQVSRPVINRAYQLAPDIIHYHGLHYPFMLQQLARGKYARSRLIGEYHSDLLSGGIKGWLQRRGLTVLERLLFTNPAHLAYWQQGTGLPAERFYFSLEASSVLRYQARALARAQTGMSGHPVFLWNSRLISRRDPQTVLRGFELLLAQWPEARLYMMVPEAEPALLALVEQQIAHSPALKSAVTLQLGRRPHGEMAALYNSADYMVSGSLDDGYGFAAADALSCGVLPIVTNIPTFAQITDGGRIGALWQTQDAASFAREAHACLQATYPQIDKASQAARAYFEQQLSYEVIATGLQKLYQDLLA